MDAPSRTPRGARRRASAARRGRTAAGPSHCGSACPICLPVGGASLAQHGPHGGAATVAPLHAPSADPREVLDREWYHTLELEPGVVTPGWFDTRRALASVPFPASLAGKRCLDVATFDGFWAFEMERRGASETLAIDLLDPTQADWPVNSDAAVIEAIGERKRAGEG